MKVEWRCTTMVNGALCVMIIGIMLMPVWCVEDLDMGHLEALHIQLHLVKEQDQSGWIELLVEDMNTT